MDNTDKCDKCGNAPCTCPKNNFGAVLLFVIIILAAIGGFIFLTKYQKNIVPAKIEVAVPTPITSQITKLACEKQYYNPVIGFPKYYLSVEGVNVSDATSVTCAFDVSVNKKSVIKTTVESPLTAIPERNGGTFRCSTKAVDLEPIIPTEVGVVLTDNLGRTATCSSAFTLPRP